MQSVIEIENQYGAHHYKPLPVILTRGQGIHVFDNENRAYIDMMSAYSAVSHGHCHPRLVKVLTSQASRLGVISRAYYSDQLAGFLKLACELTQQDMALPMNTGAEAVETALKAARKWGYTQKNIPKGQAEIIVCQGNFHGRTLAIISMSSEPQYRAGFEPLLTGFKLIPYGDSEALQQAITPNTAAFLIEPIQGEAGIHIPPPGYLKACERICRENNVLFIADEIQTGLGRTGRLLACQHENVQPDGLILGKALGGGLLPVSLFLAKKPVMEVFTPGDHGSTFGGNPLAAAVGSEALTIIVEDDYAKRSEQLGQYFLEQLKTIHSPLIQDIRGKGLFIGLEINPAEASAREICLRLLKVGILSKETHETVVRLAPPLIIQQAEIDEALEKIKRVLQAG